MSKLNRSKSLTMISILGVFIVCYSIYFNIKVYVLPQTTIFEKITAAVLLITSLLTSYYCFLGWKNNKVLFYRISVNLFALSAIFVLVSPFSVNSLQIDPIGLPIYIGLSCIVFGFLVLLATGKTSKKAAVCFCITAVVFYALLHFIFIYGLIDSTIIPNITATQFSHICSMSALSILIFIITWYYYKLKM